MAQRRTATPGGLSDQVGRTSGKNGAASFAARPTERPDRSAGLRGVTAAHQKAGTRYPGGFCGGLTLRTGKERKKKRTMAYYEHEIAIFY